MEYSDKEFPECREFLELAEILGIPLPDRVVVPCYNPSIVMVIAEFRR